MCSTSSQASSSGLAGVTIVKAHTSLYGRCYFDLDRVKVAHIDPRAARRIEAKLQAATVFSDVPDPKTECKHDMHISSPDIYFIEQSTIRNTLDEGRILAFVMTTVRTTTMAAHPSTSYAMFSFDRKTGHSYVRSEMFRPGSTATFRHLLQKSVNRKFNPHSKPGEPQTPIYLFLGAGLGQYDVLVQHDGIEVYNIFDDYAGSSLHAHVSATDLLASGIIAPAGPLRIFHK